MLGAIAAERMKLLRHRAALGLVWIFPILLTALFAIALGIRLAKGASPLAQIDPPDRWMAETAVVWVAVRHFMGLLVVGGFAAFAFGAEYGWNTWKLIVPHAPRWRLMLAKYLTVLGLLGASLALFGALSVAFSAFADGVLGAGLPHGLSLAELLRLHGKGALAALAPILLAVGVGSAAAVLLRSAMAGTVVATAVTIATNVLFTFAPMLDRQVYVALPSYHVRNLSTWATDGRSLPQGLPDGLLSLEWTTSLALMAAYVGTLIAVTMIAFWRQDLN